MAPSIDSYRNRKPWKPFEGSFVRTLLTYVTVHNLSSFQECKESDALQAKEDAIANITEDVCRPLKTRVEQILLLESNPVVLYKLTNLIRFYSSTVKQVLPAKSGLGSCLQELEQLAYQQFMKVLQSSVQQHNNKALEGPRHDLAPIPSAMALLSLLREILSVSSVADEQPDQLQDIVSAVVDPLLSHLRYCCS